MTAQEAARALLAAIHSGKAIMMHAEVVLACETILAEPPPCFDGAQPWACPPNESYR